MIASKTFDIFKMEWEKYCFAADVPEEVRAYVLQLVWTTHHGTAEEYIQ